MVPQAAPEGTSATAVTCFNALPMCLANLFAIYSIRGPLEYANKPAFQDNVPLTTNSSVHHPSGPAMVRPGEGDPDRVRLIRRTPSWIIGFGGNEGTLLTRCKTNLLMAAARRLEVPNGADWAQLVMIDSRAGAFPASPNRPFHYFKHFHD